MIEKKVKTSTQCNEFSHGHFYTNIQFSYRKKKIYSTIFTNTCFYFNRSLTLETQEQGNTLKLAIIIRTRYTQQQS